jgi:8-oxo-dGTP pyrophosphatase MutT (NUDIX family)
VVDERRRFVRHAARVLLCDVAGRILLFKARYLDQLFWSTPGGGLEGDETHEEAAKRELWEETGVHVDGPEFVCIWTRSRTFDFPDSVMDQRERYFFVRLDETPSISYENWQESDSRDLLEHRWWTAEEIEASGDVFAPRRLGQLLRALLRDGCPAEPLDVGL